MKWMQTGSMKEQKGSEGCQKGKSSYLHELNVHQRWNGVYKIINGPVCKFNGMHLSPWTPMFLLFKVLKRQNELA